MDYEKKNKDAISTIKQALRQLATNGVPVGNMTKALKDIEEKYAESEDEKIRKTICNCVKWFGLDVCFFKDVSQEECLAWLEKQGEQKPVPKFKIGDTMRTLQEAKDGWTDGMPFVVSIDSEYYNCNSEKIAIKDQDEYEYPPMNRRQKPAWMHGNAYKNRKKALTNKE